MSTPNSRDLAQTPPESPDALLDQFLDKVATQNLKLYPAQEEAILALYEGSNVILNTPTGSGKSLVAESLHFLSFKRNQKSYYTCPIKALVNEKFRALCDTFGAHNVGMITGDATINSEAPIICCTAEILSNLALRQGARAKVQDIIMDEFHYYSDRDRGMAWQVPLLTLSNSRFLLMSATLGDTEFFKDALTKLNGRKTEIVQSAKRPVPLEFHYQEIPIHETLEKLVSLGRAPAYIVHFTQRECAETAQNLLSVDFCSKDEKKAIIEALQETRFESPYGKDFQRLLKHGIGIHHAGLLPKYRVQVEKLAQQGLLKVICGTDTLGVGVNIPIRSVLFSKLCKFDGKKTSLLTVRDFQQISGRAGRKGFDDFGYVYAQAPEHIIDNKRLEEKSLASGGNKKFVKRKPPEKGYIPWDRNIFERLIHSKPEALVSQYSINHSVLLNVLSRDYEDGCRAMQHLIRSSHESLAAKKKHRKHAFELFRSLVERQIIEFTPSSGIRKRLLVNIDLQEDFSLHHALSLYLLDSLTLLDRESPTYSLDALSLCESILENPDIILRKQVDRIKTEKMNEMKASGIEYEDRIAELEKIEHPKPLRELIYQSFNEFSEKHPWVGMENIRPKSVAREMFEGYFSFADYIREYELQRSERVLLRYLSEAYKVLSQTVPDSSKDEGCEESLAYIKDLLEKTDSSLLEEWEQMKNPSRPRAVKEAQETPAPERLRNDRRFKAEMRNLLFQDLRSLSQGNLENTSLPESERGEFSKALEVYFQEHQEINTRPDARNPALIKITEHNDTWEIEQSLCDTEGPTPWILLFQLDWQASVAALKPILKLQTIRQH